MTCFKEYLGSLARLSTEKLDQSAEKVVHAERQCTARVIAHLAEISRRKAHLELGYAGLFEYGVKHLGLGEGCTGLRIHVANVCCRFPEVLDALANNEMSLTVAGRLASHLTPQNVEDLLRRAKGSSKREIEELLVSLKPRPVVSCGMRKRPDEPAPANPIPALEEPASTSATSMTEDVRVFMDRGPFLPEDHGYCGCLPGLHRH